VTCGMFREIEQFFSVQSWKGSSIYYFVPFIKCGGQGHRQRRVSMYDGGNGKIMGVIHPC
jgi:hypothetical protein